jgi:hypothetical protein
VLSENALDECSAVPRQPAPLVTLRWDWWPPGYVCHDERNVCGHDGERSTLALALIQSCAAECGHQPGMLSRWLSGGLIGLQCSNEAVVAEARSPVCRQWWASSLLRYA